MQRSKPHFRFQSTQNTVNSKKEFLSWVPPFSELLSLPALRSSVQDGVPLCQQPKFSAEVFFVDFDMLLITSLIIMTSLALTITNHVERFIGDSSTFCAQ